MTPKLGEHVCQCGACKRYFTRTSTFDQHRAWHPEDGTDETNRRRICLDPETVGLIQRDNGAWGGPPMTDEQKAAMKERLG